jgi:ankyrin repeat protein
MTCHRGLLPSLLRVSFFLPLFLLTARAAADSPVRPVAKTRNDDPAILIDRLQAVARGDMGYTPSRSGSSFLPLGKTDLGVVTMGREAPVRSDTLRELVRNGVAAVPQLVAHLGDKRPTKFTVKHDFGDGAMLFEDEYDYNRRTVKRPPEGVNRDGSDGKEHDDSHTVTVGDLCFVALGQIVNRNFNAVRYQPTACIMINSPSDSEVLRKVTEKEWGGLTPARHKESLVRDFVEPDREDRRIGACFRLGFYYPEALEPLALKQLAEPRYDVFEVEALIREKLYRTKDAAERKKLFDEFIAKRGEVARQGCLLRLFEDLDTQEYDEKGRLGPPLKEKYAARACLIELYGYPKSVKSTEKPRLLPTENAMQARFIDALAAFATPKLDRAVREVLHSTDDDTLAASCVRFLVGRGVDADIHRYVEQRRKGADEKREKELRQMLDRLGWTPLHAAAEQGESAVAEGLILKGAEVNARAANGQTPLHVAAARGSYGTLEVLLKHKADPNAKDHQRRTPVQLAIGYDGAVSTLLAAGAEPSDILVAAFAGRADLVKGFITRDKNAVAAKTPDGDTPLHLAVCLGHLKVAEILLDNGADVNARDSSQITPLHRAVTLAGPEMVALLLSRKADRGAKSWNGKTPLDFARERDRTEIIPLLEKRP